jgi:hypothetical protein
MQSISFLEAFNAKTMTTQKIAESFVPSEKFRELAGPWNSLLLGPRGSGKTTLLKMLQLPALRAWKHPDAEEYRRQIGFTGIFVPADIAWSEMIEAMKESSFSSQAGDLVAKSVYCTNVLLATVDAMSARICQTPNSAAPQYHHIEPERNNLQAALIEICNFWGVKPTVLSLSGIRAALQKRLIDTQSLVSELSLRTDSSFEDLAAAMPYIHMELNTVVQSALVQFDEAICDEGAKWALLFDEFEIAPEEIQEAVFRRIRSTNEKLIYKIGLAPCTPHTLTSLKTAAPISEGNDFKRTVLWYPDKNSAVAFSEQIFRAKVSIYPQFQDRSPNEILGKTAYLTEDDDEKPYGQGDEWEHIFVSLKNKDEDFAKFLVDRNIDPTNLETSSDTPTGSTVRKIAPLVAFRDAYKREGSGASKGRKKLTFAYSGSSAIFAICEGNPRWLIGITNMMLAARQSNSNKILPSIQVDKVLRATEAFAAMLSTVATHQPIGLKTDQPIDRILRQIGDYFFRRVVKDKYTEEPPLSFEVDSKVSEQMENSLRIAFNHGAIVNIPDNDGQDNNFETLRGKRFRLAYLLAPRFKLPLRATKQVALSKIVDVEYNEQEIVPLQVRPTQTLLNLTD